MSLQIVENTSVHQESNGESPTFDLSEYRARIGCYIDVSKEENGIFFDALEFACALHAGQRRKSGTPYISHPCSVAEILVRELLIRDPALLAAALLHDVVEDVPAIRIEDIENRFGETVAELVDGCTKLTRYHLDRSALKDLTHSKIFVSSSRRLGVLIIKLVDRLHNLRTLHYLPGAKRQRIAQETVEVYAPIAARLGIFPLKRELYDLALSFLYPRKSKKILHAIQGIPGASETIEVEDALRSALAAASISAAIRIRSKGLGSYYNPLKRTLELGNAENHVDFTIVLDTEDVLRCYSVLGAVDTTFPPIPRTIRDFIATPKNNTYRSLHVRIHVKGRNYLVKIRTPFMDGMGTYGVLFQWNAEKPLEDEHWGEVSELLRSIGEYGGAGSRRKALIRQIESEEIFIYTPRGDIHHFPKGSTVLDFAYKIHSDIGEYCSGAMVNNVWEAPTHVLKDGDMVEAITSEEPLDADPDLENICKTPKARTAINRRLQHKRRRYAEELGRQILLQECEKHGFSWDVLLKDEKMPLILEIIGASGLQDLFVRIGQDLLSPHLILYYFNYFAGPPPMRKEPAQKHPATPALHHGRNAIFVSDLDKAIHKFARCCNPYPGQEHVLATLSERGITFHHRDCTDLVDRHDLSPLKLLDTVWIREAHWRRPLVFHLQIWQETPTSLFPSLARLPSNIRVRGLREVLERNGQSCTELSVSLRSFEEAAGLFSCLPESRVVIDDYARFEELRTGPAAAARMQ